jgi:hypothetical protein
MRMIQTRLVETEAGWWMCEEISSGKQGAGESITAAAAHLARRLHVREDQIEVVEDIVSCR